MNLTKTMYYFFAARRYWSDEAMLQESYLALARELGAPADCRLVTEPDELVDLEAGQTLVAVPMSGAVQSMILQAAKQSAVTVLLAGYVEGCFSHTHTQRMLERNAAPTVMDCWAVLRRGGQALLATGQVELEHCRRAAESVCALRSAKLLLVGQPEPWVISVSRETQRYTSLLGVTIEQVEQRELEACYRATGDAAADAFSAPIRAGADGMREPTVGDLRQAGRMGAALSSLLDQHSADGVAVACFSLLSTGTTACLGVSILNDSGRRVAACEGDLDSACTMLLMKGLASTRLWMANPSLQADGTVSFSHCTAPLHICGTPCPYLLRSHHESGIGVSPQVELPLVERVTACRISSEEAAVTIQTAVPVPGPREATCRTQLRVRWDAPDRYLPTALGCHQVFAFEDISHELRLAAGLLGLTQLC